MLELDSSVVSDAVRPSPAWKAAWRAQEVLAKRQEAIQLRQSARRAQAVGALGSLLAAVLITLVEEKTGWGATIMWALLIVSVLFMVSAVAWWRRAVDLELEVLAEAQVALGEKGDR